jgi:hypothetical protein
VAAGSRANEEQSDHYSARHEKRTIAQRVSEIQRATDQFAPMRYVASQAEKLEKNPSLSQRFENSKGVWGGTFEQMVKPQPPFHSPFLSSAISQYSPKFVH